MTGKEFLDYIHLITRTDSDTLSTTDILLFANVRLETISRAIMNDDEDTLIMPMTTNLIANLREYPYPCEILSRIKYVEAKFDGTNWIHLDEMDLNQYRKPTSETDIVANFGNELGRAFYDISRKALNIYSGVIANVTDGLKLWCNTYIQKLDASRLTDETTDLSVDPTTTTHGFPRELHELWARGVSIDYKSTREKPIPLTEQEMNYKNDLTQAIWDLKHGNADRSFMALIPDASDRGNDGMNY